MDMFFGRYVSYDKPKTRYEINKNLRKFNKNHNTTKICARFMEIFVLFFCNIKHKGTRDTLHFFLCCFKVQTNLLCSSNNRFLMFI